MCDSGYRRDNHVGGRKKICKECSISKEQRCVFYTGKGDLTPYSFLCGYIEQRGRMSLSKEHGIYHVKGFDQNEKHVHESYDTLYEARKFFRTFPKVSPVRVMKELVQENK